MNVKSEFLLKGACSPDTALGIPNRTMSTICGGLDDTGPITASKRWLKTKRSMLILSGPVGVGKTVAACWCGLHFGKESEILHNKSGWNHDKPTRVVIRDSIMRFTPSFKIASVPPWNLYKLDCFHNFVVVIDDVGSEVGTIENMRVRYDTLLTHRHNEGLVTIITTNMAAPSFKSYVGERVVDRIREDGVFVETATRSLRQYPENPLG